MRNSFQESAKYTPIAFGQLILTLLFFILAFPQSSFTQDAQTVRGHIVDRATDAPLSGAHIGLEGTSLGTFSGPDGSFRIKVTGWPAVLKVSFIGYEEMEFTISEDMAGKEVVLGLAFKPELLEGVTISDQRVELVYKDPSYSVLDFEFHEYGLMLLIYRNSLRRADLVLLSMMDDTLAVYENLPGRAVSLFRDCQQNLHYVASDSAYQVFYQGQSLKLLYPIHSIKFEVVSKAFFACLDHKFYYGIRRMQDQVMQYIRYDSLHRSYKPFWTVADQATLQILKDNPIHHYLLDNLVKSRNPEEDFDIYLMGAHASAEDQRLSLSLSRGARREAHYLKSCVYHPVYAPLFTYKNKLVIFNHPNDRIEIVTSEGECLSRTPVEYQNEADWARLILKDDIREKFYTVEIENTRTSLQLINPETGERGLENPLYFTQVKKVLVRNGYAYFTYHQPGSLERTMLFRQKLKSWDAPFSD